jgi:hypothetical protein
MALSALVQVLDSVVVGYLTEELRPFEILFFRTLFSLRVLAAVTGANRPNPEGQGALG